MTFSIRATHNGRHTWLAQGDKIDLEFEDGKGVSGRIGDVNVEPGGSSFSIIVTHDGQPLVRAYRLSDLGMAMSDIMGAADARPETACDEATDAEGSNDPTPGERDLLNALKVKSRQAENLKHKVEELRNELEFRTRREAEKDRIIDSRTRQLERSRRHHDEKNDLLANLHRAMNASTEEIEALRASLKDLGEDYRIVQEMLEQERAEKKKAEGINQIRGTFRTGITTGRVIGPISEQHITINSPSTEQVLAARERPRQRVVTQHDVDGSVNIRVELREGN